MTYSGRKKQREGQWLATHSSFNTQGVVRTKVLQVDDFLRYLKVQCHSVCNFLIFLCKIKKQFAILFDASEAEI